MGIVYAEIELINSVDLEDARRHIIGEDEIRRMLVRMIVDSGAWMLCINEKMKPGPFGPYTSTPPKKLQAEPL